VRSRPSGRRILVRQPHIRASLADVQERVGLLLADGRRERVRLFPRTPVRELRARGVPEPDAVVVADVLHHVRAHERGRFLEELAAFGGRSIRVLVVKDVADFGWRARLGLLSDRYVTGDRHTQLLTASEVKQLVARAFPDFAPRDTSLIDHDPPNYCIVFEKSVV
jgi:hypothetical protein